MSREGRGNREQRDALSGEREAERPELVACLAQIPQPMTDGLANQADKRDGLPSHSARRLRLLSSSGFIDRPSQPRIVRHRPLLFRVTSYGWSSPHDWLRDQDSNLEPSG